jgi:hypothetical protein
VATNSGTGRGIDPDTAGLQAAAHRFDTPAVGLSTEVPHRLDKMPQRNLDATAKVDRAAPPMRVRSGRPGSQGRVVSGSHRQESNGNFERQKDRIEAGDLSGFSRSQRCEKPKSVCRSR